MAKSFLFFVYILIIMVLTGTSAMAKWGTFTITDDKGDQVLVKHGLFGKKTIVKDRYGNGFGHSKSIFGLTKDTQVGVLGNEAHVHKGLFGFGKTEGHDVLGDSVSSKNNPLYRNTNINLSGANSFLSKVLAPKSTIPQTNPNVPEQVEPIPITPAKLFPNPNKPYGTRIPIQHPDPN